MLRNICTFAMTMLVGAAAFASECRVMESRNSYVGYAQALGLTEAPIARIQNPYKTLANGSANAKARAQAALSLAASELVQTGRATSAGAASLTDVQERAGVDILTKARAADYVLVYGSERVRPDGSLQLAYETIDLKSASRVGHVAQISRSQAANLFAQACSMHDCNPRDVAADPANHVSIVKGALGAYVARSLHCDARETAYNN